MKNKEILNAVHHNFLSITAHCLEPVEYMQYFATKRAIRNLYAKFAQSEKEILKELGITEKDMATRPDGTIFISPKKANGEVDTELLNKYNALINELINQDVKLPEIKKLPIEQYKALYDENKKGDKDLLADPVLEEFVLEVLFEQI